MFTQLNPCEKNNQLQHLVLSIFSNMCIAHGSFLMNQHKFPIKSM